jgi:aryl-alcohol dehydrogenase-like predicted oxidoreductase
VDDAHALLVRERAGDKDGSIVRSVAADHGCTPAQAAIAWLLQRPAPPAVIPNSARAARSSWPRTSDERLRTVR